MRVVVTVLIAASVLANTEMVFAAPSPTSPLDQYGTIAWENEKARLDNFAIAIQNYPKALGYIVIFDEDGGCEGEAKARAIRAKRYVVEHRGIPWNRVIWRVEGYQREIYTTLLIAPPGALVPYPYRDGVRGKDGPLTKRCETRLRQIARSRW
jgi:hypothetical protein